MRRFFLFRGQRYWNRNTTCVEVRTTDRGAGSYRNRHRKSHATPLRWCVPIERAFSQVRSFGLAHSKTCWLLLNLWTTKRKRRIPCGVYVGRGRATCCGTVPRLLEEKKNRYTRSSVTSSLQRTGQRTWHETFEVWSFRGHRGRVLDHHYM
jgi:hypothetical protein